MSKFSFKKLNNNKKKQWIANKHEAVAIMYDDLCSFENSKQLDSDKERLRKIGFNAEKHAGEIMFVLARMNSSTPIQNLMGSIANIFLNKSRNPLLTAYSFMTAGELALFLNKFIQCNRTLNGHIVVESKIYDKELDTVEFYPLPESEPTDYHKPLGCYSWEREDIKALDLLNKTAFTILDFDEEEPAKDTEEHVKYTVRKSLRSYYLGKEIYFNWHPDYRYRMYAGGYHFNPQGNEYEKSIMAFAESERVGLKGYKQLKMSIASAFGQDKKTDKSKVKWFNTNKNNLDWKLAKEPHTARKLLYALEQVQKTGETNVPVELDATNSQLQMVACLTGDRQTASICNVLNRKDGEIADAYQTLADVMSLILERTGLGEHKFTRSELKATHMISGYGAGRSLVEETFQEDFGEAFDEKYVDIFYQAQKVVSPAAVMLRDYFNSIWDSSKDYYEWTLPDGVKVQYRPTETRQITTKPYGVEINCLATVNMATSKSTGLGVNIIHSVDAYVARQVIERCKKAGLELELYLDVDCYMVSYKGFDVWSIHDGFNSLPQYSHILKRIYAEILAEITDSTLLEDIIYEVSGNRVVLNKGFTGDEVRKAKYPLC